MSSLFPRLTAALNYFPADRGGPRWWPVLDINNQPQSVSVEREQHLLLCDDCDDCVVKINNDNITIGNRSGEHFYKDVFQQNRL